jgi:hypothetical protein
VYCAGVLTGGAIGPLYKTHEFRHQEVSSLEVMGALHLKIAAFHKIVEGAIQFLPAGFRAATALNGRAYIAVISLLTGDQQFDQLGRIDEGESASIGAAIFIEDAAEGLAANLDLWDESILCRGMRHTDLQIDNCG